MKLLTIIAMLAVTACNPPPPRRTVDGKTCTWVKNSRDSDFDQGICIKGGMVYTCFFDRAAEPEVVCGTTGPMPAETPSPKVAP